MYISNIILRGKLCEAIRFVCAQETGVFLQTNKLALDKTGVINETAASVLTKNICTNTHHPPFYFVDIKQNAYFIPVYMVGVVVK